MRLIDADAFLEDARNGKGMQYIHLPINTIALLIGEMPTVDAEPVVRCKECKYNRGEINKKGFLICSANGMDITDDDYCSWGERMKTIKTNQHLTGVTTITDNNDEITSIIIDGEGYSKAKYGIWIYRAEAMFGNPYGHYECSICGNGMPHKTQYCCYCGAKMDEGEEE